MYSGEYDACDVTLIVYPHRESLKNMPGIFFRCGYTLRVTSQASYSPEYITPTQKKIHDFPHVYPNQNSRLMFNPGFALI
jgi:hypothetical protein